MGAAGALSGVAEYEKHRERGAELPPLPTLFVVVDEFAELLQNHPDFIALFDRICRVGRSLRVHLLLATQSLNTGGVRIDKLEPNLTYRIALRTTSSAESKAVIGTPEAQYITNKESGVGFLRVGMEDPVKFHSVYTGMNYVPTRGRTTSVRCRARQPRRAPMRIRPFTAAPICETAMTSVIGHRVRTARPARGRPRAADHRRDPRLPNVVAAVDRSDAGQRTGRARPAAQPLRFGLGIMDEPRRHRQEVWGVDVSAAGGNIAVGGAPQTGKSTFLQTLMLSAAATHTPRQVQFYCIDLGGGGLMYLEDLPHVGGVATRSEPDRVNRMVAEMKAVLRQREATFKQYRVGSIATYRQMRDDPNHPASADPFGDVFLVIDGWPAFIAEFPELEPVVQDLAGQGLAFGVHTVISTPRWTELKSRVRDYLGTKLEFRLGDVNETQIDRITREIPVEPARPRRLDGEAPPDDRRAAPRRRAQRAGHGARDHGGRRAHRIAAHRRGAEGQGAARSHLPQ